MAVHSHNVLVNRLHDRALKSVANRSAGRLIDIGCGIKPHRSTFAPYVESHIGLDRFEASHGLREVDIVGTAYDIPVPDRSFETVLCTCVLEHLEEPVRALREAQRVLTPEGIAIYTVPLHWHLHEEPRDFFRFTKYGLSHIFHEAGFEVEEIRGIGGFWVTFGQAASYYVERFRRGILRRGPLVPLVTWLIQACAAALDRIDPAPAWTCLYLVVATPSSGERRD
jgi:SAM-dependent methyltransferase